MGTTTGINDLLRSKNACATCSFSSLFMVQVYECTTRFYIAMDVSRILLCNSEGPQEIFFLYLIPGFLRITPKPEQTTSHKTLSAIGMFHYKPLRHWELPVLSNPRAVLPFS